jgi:hypothetical protein
MGGGGPAVLRMIKAIETRYKGYRFRSRLEARWAIHLDLLRIHWEYEREGFDLDGECYLPDFWLPTLKTWIEIKGQQPNEKEDRLAMNLCEYSESDVILWSGDPLNFEETEHGSIDYLQTWWSYDTDIGAVACGFTFQNLTDHFATTPHLWRKAGAVARSARFEHGETPRI